MIDQSIFREYDIRGIVPDQINDASIKAIASAIANKCHDEKVHELALGRDGRLSGNKILKSLSQELQFLGINIVNIGVVTSPLLYFAAKKLNSKSGVMITGSHNPKNYNGFKVVINDSPVSGIEMLSLISSEMNHSFAPGLETIKENLEDEYIEEVISQASKQTQKIKVVVDCGNGSAGKIAPKLMRALGYEVVELYCEIDGNFPNHHPDPGKVENLQDLIKRVKDEGADIGIAFDGDGDRLGVISNLGEIIYPDQLMMIFSRAVLKNSKGREIIFDVKCSNLLAKIISEAGGMPVMSPTGHFHIKNALKKTNAPLAGEMSGHIFFNDRWPGFDDGIYAGARMLEIIANSEEDNVFNSIPHMFSTPEINISSTDEEKFKIVEQFKNDYKFENATIIDIDGIRIEFEKGWGLLRASNTSPVLVLRFEAETEEELIKIKNIFLKNLQDIKADIKEF